MKKKLLMLFTLLSLSAFSLETASQFDEYSTREPAISKGYKQSKNNINTTYFYHENDSYKVITRAGYITTIILNPDENLIHAEIGDATRWSVQTYYTGTSKGMAPAVSIKPFIPELRTNLVLSTDKRMYNIVLEANMNTYSPVIAFEYPQDIELANAKKDFLKSQERKVNLNNINFDYSWKKNNKAPFTPETVYDDGETTYILMPERVKVTQIPTLFIRDEQTGEAASVRHRYDPNTRLYTVDRLLEQAILKYGDWEVLIKRKGSFIKTPNDHISISL